VHAFDRGRDAAVLIADTPLPDTVSGLLAAHAVTVRTGLAITGPAVQFDGRLYRFLDATGTWQGLVEREDGVLLARIESSAVLPGMSGSPVRRIGDDHVVGVVSGRYNSANEWLRNSVWLVRNDDLMPLLDGVCSVELSLAATPSTTSQNLRPMDLTIDRPTVL
jgi:hypothetical protein